MARICAGCSSPMLVPSSASSALNSTFCAFQPMVLKARVTPTAAPSASALAVFSASICAALRARAIRSPPALMSLSSTVARTSESTKLVAIRPLKAIEAAAASSCAAASSSAAISSSDVGSSSAAASSAATSSSAAASSSAMASPSSGSLSLSSGSSWSDSKAMMLAEPRASKVTSPSVSMAALSTRVLTVLRTSLRTSCAPNAAWPSLPVAAPMRATMPEVSLALTSTLPPMANTVSSVSSITPASFLGVSSTCESALTRLEASVRPTATPPLD